MSIWLLHGDVRRDEGHSIPNPERVKSEALTAHWLCQIFHHLFVSKRAQQTHTEVPMNDWSTSS